MSDLQAFVDAMGSAMQAERSNYHLTLGRFIKALEASRQDALVVFSHDKGKHPGLPMSYRGYYADLAFSESKTPRTVGELLPIARQCIGDTFPGYKGGDYTMDERIPLWCAEYGCSGVAIVGTDHDESGNLILITKQDEGD